ncbi:hypothetical protein [Clostridium sp. Marseille-Q2269]|uniref:hypothetical protein n=1 Tax=Clostridium sp. Marseille-Q2269 TaxID=2942205 RepID=UPI0020739376|nr:hypothetical protein [Clostridium sp. Marseille-Q2269]
MNSNIYDRKKQSYKNRPYYCPINNMWFNPYMYMNPYTSYMINPFMSQYMDPYMMYPQYGNMCSCNKRPQCEATRAYDENDYNFEEEDIHPDQYEEDYIAQENKQRSYEEDSLDDIVTFDDNDKNERSEKEENPYNMEQQIQDSDLKSGFKKKKGIQMEEANKFDKAKEKEFYRGIKINMRKVPIKEITD